jgi:hypothetical protein
MNISRSLSFCAASVLSAGSCFGGLLDLTDGTKVSLYVSHVGGVAVKGTFPKPDNLNGPLNPSTPSTFSTNAGLFEIDHDVDGSVFSDRVFFCFELHESINVPAAYTSMTDAAAFRYYEGLGLLATDSILTASTLGLIENLFSQYWKGSSVGDWTSTERAAMQLAIWELAYDATPGSISNGEGDFYVSTNTTAAQNAIAQANLWLATVQDKGVSDNVAGFISLKYQNQITYVPEPSVLGLQAIFLGALLLRRKRNRR